MPELFSIDIANRYQSGSHSPEKLNRDAIAQFQTHSVENSNVFLNFGVSFPQAHASYPQEKSRPCG
ncbi:hypothetical protein [Leptolyngbya sp. NIES-2104]|uniref:hypothetical protein n=1 Tax=Leptolyngbya sp. NIES-2104 TaxID=1552121 RepID=UPI0012E3B8E1|nr:hypothetical protein [Leptolyngbya sp. NIES-2104]